MSRRSALAPLAAVAFVIASTAGVASTAVASSGPAMRPSTSCQVLHQRAQRDYDVYQEDLHAYGKNSQRTRQAYDTYEQALHRYNGQCQKA